MGIDFVPESDPFSLIYGKLGRDLDSERLLFKCLSFCGNSEVVEVKNVFNSLDCSDPLGRILFVDAVYIISPLVLMLSLNLE